MIPRSPHTYEASRERGRRSARTRRLVRTVLLLVLAYIGVHGLLLQTIRVGGSTMAPTVVAGERLIVFPLAYGPRVPAFGWILPGFSEPQRGDLVVARPGFMPGTGTARLLVNPLVRFFTLEKVRLDDGPNWLSARTVKRIVAIPGDTVRMERFVFYVRPEGSSRFLSEFEVSSRQYATVQTGLPEGWLSDDPFGDAMEERTLGPDEYFIVGDNRIASIDSRHWGPVSRADLIGRVAFRYWPLGNAGSP